jgi:hypothetical protein
MPQAVGDHTFQPFDPPMVRLVKDMGGPIRVPISHDHEYKVPVGPYDFVDPMTFSGGPIRDEVESDRMLRSLGLPPLPKRKRKGDDDEDDDDMGDTPGMHVKKRVRRQRRVSSRAKGSDHAPVKSKDTVKEEESRHKQKRRHSLKNVDVYFSDGEASCADSLNDDDSEYCSSVKPSAPEKGKVPDASVRSKRSSVKHVVRYCEDDKSESEFSDEHDGSRSESRVRNNRVYYRIYNILYYNVVILRFL